MPSFISAEWNQPICVNLFDFDVTSETINSHSFTQYNLLLIEELQTVTHTDVTHWTFICCPTLGNLTFYLYFEIKELMSLSQWQDKLSLWGGRTLLTASPNKKKLLFASGKHHHFANITAIYTSDLYGSALHVYYMAAAALLSDSFVTNICGRKTRDEIYYVVSRDWMH